MDSRKTELKTTEGIKIREPNQGSARGMGKNSVIKEISGLETSFVANEEQGQKERGKGASDNSQ